MSPLRGSLGVALCRQVFGQPFYVDDYTGLVALRAPFSLCCRLAALRAAAVLWLAYSLRHGIVCVAPSGLGCVVGCYLGFHSLRSFHPRLFCVTASRFSRGCSMTAGFRVDFLWLAYSQHVVCTPAHRVSFAFGSLRPVLSCGALTGLS